MPHEALIEQLRAWAATLTAINRGDHGPIAIAPEAAAHLAVTIVGLQETADDLERDDVERDAREARHAGPD